MNFPWIERSWPLEDVPFHEVVTRTDIFQKRADFFWRKYIGLIELIAECFLQHPSRAWCHNRNFSAHDVLKSFIMDMKVESEKIGLWGPLAEIFYIVQKLLTHSVPKSNEVLFHEYIAPPGTIFIANSFSEVQNDRLFGLPVFTLDPGLFDVVSKNFWGMQNESLFYINPRNPLDYFILFKAWIEKPIFHQIGHFLFYLLKPEKHVLKDDMSEFLFYRLVNEAIASIWCDDAIPPSLAQIYPWVPVERIPANIQEALHDLQFAWTLITNRAQPRKDRLVYVLLHSSDFHALRNQLAAMCVSLNSLFPVANTSTRITKEELLEISWNRPNDFLEEVFATRIQVFQCLMWLKSRWEKRVSLPIQERKYPTIFCFLMWQLAQEIGIELPTVFKDALAQRVICYPGFLPEEKSYLESHRGVVQVLQSMNAYILMRTVEKRWKQ